VDASIQEYIEVLKINPGHAVSRVNLGVMLVRQNHLEEAIQQFEAALQLDPNYKEAQEYLAQVRAKRAQKP
jgi:tetratricopeptide (TPR) repeat protein